MEADELLPAAGVEEPGLAAEEQGREDGSDVELCLGLLRCPSGSEDAPGRSKEFCRCCDSALDGVADLAVAVAKGPEVDVGVGCGEESPFFFVDWDGGGGVVGAVLVDPVGSPFFGVCC